MDDPRLGAAFKGVLSQLKELSSEIDGTSGVEDSDELIETMRAAALDILEQKRKRKEELVTRFHCIVEEYTAKRKLISESDSNDVDVGLELTIPYQGSVDKASSMLKLLNSDVSQRSSRMRSLEMKINELSIELNVDTPKIGSSNTSGTLSDSNLKAIMIVEAELQKEKDTRMKLFNEVYAKIVAMEKYLKIEAPFILPKVLDNNTLATVKQFFKETAVVYEKRKEEISSIEHKVKHLANLLREDPQLGDIEDGSESRRLHLESRLMYFEKAKSERREQLALTYSDRLQELWYKLSLDISQRIDINAFDITEHMDDVEKEICRLEALTEDPSRAEIHETIELFYKTKNMEMKLKENQADRTRLAGPGIVAKLNEDAYLEKFVSTNLPVVIPKLTKSVEDWKQTHNGETFYIKDGGTIREITLVLSEESERINRHKPLRRIGKQTKTAASRVVQTNNRGIARQPAISRSLPPRPTTRGSNTRPASASVNRNGATAFHTHSSNAAQARSVTRPQQINSGRVGKKPLPVKRRPLTTGNPRKPQIKDSQAVVNQMKMPKETPGKGTLERSVEGSSELSFINRRANNIDKTSPKSGVLAPLPDNIQNVAMSTPISARKAKNWKMQSYDEEKHADLSYFNDVTENQFDYSHDAF